MLATSQRSSRNVAVSTMPSPVSVRVAVDPGPSGVVVSNSAPPGERSINDNGAPERSRALFSHSSSCATSRSWTRRSRSACRDASYHETNGAEASAGASVQCSKHRGLSRRDRASEMPRRQSAGRVKNGGKPRPSWSPPRLAVCPVLEHGVRERNTVRGGVRPARPVPASVTTASRAPRQPPRAAP